MIRKFKKLWFVFNQKHYDKLRNVLAYCLFVAYILYRQESAIDFVFLASIIFLNQHNKRWK